VGAEACGVDDLGSARIVRLDVAERDPVEVGALDLADDQLALEGGGEDLVGDAPDDAAGGPEVEVEDDGAGERGQEDGREAERHAQRGHDAADAPRPSRWAG